NDPYQIERKAHSLKGTVASFGAMRAYDLAYELESMGRSSATERRTEVYEQLKVEMAHLKLFFGTGEWEKNA
ncbi:hypothetical protein BVY01_01345, partial [bacterium I07]